MMTHFNPTLVQLEFAAVFQRNQGQLNFNPTLVQLEWVMHTCKRDCFPKFQSHIGAIRMSMKIILLWYIAIFQSHIGAIRIREKRRKRYMEALFQSHIGAIRICRDSFNFSQALHFNPTLVQLELNPCCNQHQHIATFQSHIGAIRIDSLFAASAREICISIPHWCN